MLAHQVPALPNQRSIEFDVVCALPQESDLICFALCSAVPCCHARPDALYIHIVPAPLYGVSQSHLAVLPI